MRINQLDLNLFKVFEAIYQERNLTRAAEVLSLSQPAVSNALARLRKSFNDRLFVRTPQGMVPTPVAENIVARAQQALQLLNSCVQEGDVFKPEQSNKEFHFRMNDMGEALVLPPLIEHLQLAAPEVSINSGMLNRQDVVQELASGAVDFVVDVPVLNDRNLCHQTLSAAEEYVCAVRKDHPIIKQGLTLKRYLALKHIHISSRRRGLGLADIALNTLGYQRNIQFRVQHYLAAPEIIRRSDLACTMPIRLAETYGLVGIPIPFDIEQLELHLYWHKSSDKDQANMWLRETLFGLLV